MSTNDPQQSLAQALETPISRRRAIQIAAAAGAAAFLGGTTAARVTAQSPAAAPVGGSFRMATWIGYMDFDENGFSPSLEKFQVDTGVTIDYQEAVEGNEEFFAADLQGPLSNDLPTGWDLVVLTDEMSQRLVDYGWLEPIDGAAPNYPANLLEIYQTRDWDPGNVFAAPWVSGMTGLGYDQAVTGPLTNLDILFAPDYAGRLTYLAEFRDTVGLSALRLGIDPTAITEDQFQAALVPVRTAVDDGTVRQITGNSYVNDMASGDVVLATAWSGDIVGTLVPAQTDGQDFQWTLADQGGMLWTDNMSIPKGAANKTQAQAFINWYYTPANAATIGAFIQYVVPVKGADAAMVEVNPALATNTLIFPDEAMRQRLYQFRSLDLDTAQAWTDAYNEIIGL